MKIYDIAQEVFGSAVFPGDPSPERYECRKIIKGDICNLTAFKMGAHNGTHVDAPSHFFDGAKTIDEVDLNRFIGYAYVTAHEGEISAEDAEMILKKAKEAGEQLGKADEFPDKRILVKGNAVVTEEAAEVFAANKLLLFGNESQTVGPESDATAVHLIMLNAEIVLLEGIRLSEIQEGIYFLNAAPINLGGAEGAPCRAVLITS